MDKKQIIERIEKLMVEKGITKYELRENAEISSTIYQWRKNATRDKDRIPSLRSIEKICEYFQVSLSYFFAFDAKTQNDVRTRELIAKIENLSDKQIILLQNLIDEFRN